MNTMTLLNKLPLELEIIIMDYKIELDSNVCLECNTKLCNKCLENENNNNIYIHNEFVNKMELNVNDDFININWNKNEINIKIPNINKWYPSVEEMVVDLFFNYRTFQDNNKESFVEEHMEEHFEGMWGDIEEYEDELERIKGIWNTIEEMEYFVEGVIGENYMGLFNKESFLEFINEL